MVKHCSYGLCKSDSRIPEDGVTFVTFPKPWINKRRASRWVFLCMRKNFTLKHINRSTYVCSKHFKKGVNLNWMENEDLEPLPIQEKPSSSRRVLSRVLEDVS